MDTIRKHAGDMAPEEIRAHKGYLTKRLFIRLFIMLGLMGYCIFGPSGWIKLIAIPISWLSGLPFGIALRKSIDFDAELRSIGQSPFDRRRS